MKHEQLRSFIAVVEKGSFRAAAEYLHKTQSTVSAAVAALEQQFSIQLLSRESYRPALTEAGRAFYLKARELMQQAAELEEMAHQLTQSQVPQLSLSISAQCACPAVLALIQDFCQQHPNLALSLHTEHLSGVLEQLLTERADLAIGPHRGVDERYDFTSLGEIDMVTVVAPGLLGSELMPGQIVPQSALRPLANILISDSGREQTFDHLNVLANSRQWFVNDYHMKKTLLLAGLGWARIPAHMVHSELATGSLLAIKVERFNWRNRVPIYLIRRRQQAISEPAQRLWQQVTGAATE